MLINDKSVTKTLSTIPYTIPFRGTLNVGCVLQTFWRLLCSHDRAS